MKEKSRAAVPAFEVSEEWVSALPFEKRPKGITHLPLECVMDVPSTQGDQEIEASEFAARRDETADILVSRFGGCRESMATGRYRGRDGAIISRRSRC